VHTIILEDFGSFLGKKSDRFIVKKKGQTLGEFPVSQVDRILVSSAGASLSSAALYLAVENRIPVSFTYSDGTPFGFLTPTRGHGTVLTRRAQYLEASSEVGALLARRMIEGKMLNQKHLLLSWSKNRARTDRATSDHLDGLAREIDPLLSKLGSHVGPLDDSFRQALMNIEGRAAVHYWSGVSAVLPDSLEFTGRTTRGASDAFNMLLNYGYGVLYSEVWAAVNTAGLDPFAGFLHVDRPGRPSLVLDLIEEFRQQSVDRVLVTMFSRRMLGPDIKGPDGTLSKNARTSVATGVIERLEERVQFLESKIPLKNVILKQAWAAAKLLRREATDYRPFYQRW
jgi:CRISPR-associated protein Cas1